MTGSGNIVAELPSNQLCSVFTEKLWVPSGPADGGGDAGCVLHHGLAMVRSSHRVVHLTCEQPEAGVGELSSGGAASLPGHQRAEAHRPAHLLAHGLLGVHDWSPAGRSQRTVSLADWDFYTLQKSHFTICFK